MSRYGKVLVFYLFVIQTNGQYEGDKCFNNGVEGVCVTIKKCQSAKDDIRYRRPPQLCSFSNTDTIVCCTESTHTTARIPVHTTKRITTPTEYIPMDKDHVLNIKRSYDQFQPILDNYTAPKTGQKAWDKCIDYQHKLIFRSEKGVTLTGASSRVNKCYHDIMPIILGGVNAGKDEFPHMVLLGYGQNANSLQWVCGGSLISERFILTAGHCTSARDIGPVSYVRVGALRRTDQLTPAQLYAVSDIIKHPQYHSSQQYYDIALLKTDRDVILDEFTVPACLDVGASGDYSRVLATGWGATQNGGGNADYLQKVILNKFTTAECTTMFPPSRRLKQGFDVNTQICYGDKDKSRDTCQGDSGGPIQIKSEQLRCMYTVVGVTSFGRACGFIGDPGLYTRVEEFVPWIESLVWP